MTTITQDEQGAQELGAPWSDERVNKVMIHFKTTAFASNELSVCRFSDVHSMMFSLRDAWATDRAAITARIAELESQVKRLKNDQRDRIAAQLMARGEAACDG